MDVADWVKRFFKRQYVKFKIGVRKSKLGELEDEVEYRKICMAICRNLIRQADTQLVMAPLSGRRYIRNSRLGMFISLQDRHVNIINHVYNYSVFLNLRDWEKLMYIYDNESEKRRMEYEEQIKSQIDHSLHKILENLQQQPLMNNH